MAISGRLYIGKMQQVRHGNIGTAIYRKDAAGTSLQYRDGYYYISERYGRVHHCNIGTAITISERYGKGYHGNIGTAKRHKKKTAKAEALTV